MFHPCLAQRAGWEVLVNKIFSRVWNISLGMLVVASELARTRGKAGRANRGAIAASAIVVIGMALTPGFAEAESAPEQAASAMQSTVTSGAAQHRARTAVKPSKKTAVVTHRRILAPLLPDA